MLKSFSHRALILSTIVLSSALALPAAAVQKTAKLIVDEVILFTEIDLAPMNLASKIMDSDAYIDGVGKIGDVSDVVLDESGKAIAITVGVGGFLGIDETYVAIPMKKISLQYSESYLRIIADITKEELKKATKTH
jgi:hypothetical protein